MAAGLAQFQKNWMLWGDRILGLPHHWVRDDRGDLLKHFVFTDDQAALIQSVMVNKRTLGQSGHGTGKTFAAAFIALAFLSLYPDSQVICTSSSQFQVTERLWAEVTRNYRRSKIPLGPPDLISATRLRYNEKWFAVATATNDPNNIQGGHAEHLLVVIDEAQGVEKGIWDAAESMIVAGGGRLLAIFNPLSSSGPAYEASRNPQDWNLVKLSCLRHPNVVYGREIVKGAVTRDWVEGRKRELGVDHPLYQARVLGEFPTTSEDTLISILDLENSVETWKPLGDGIWIGIDIARFGSDSNWAVIVHNGKVIHEAQWAGLDLMVTAGKIQELVANYDIPWTHVNIDGIGIGAGVIDRLRELNHEVNDIQFGGRAQNDWNNFGLGTDEMDFLNRRAELYWVMRELLKAKKITVPRRFTRIWADTLAPRYEFRSDGALKIESKDDIKARIGRSPDAADAFVLALARDCNATPRISFI